MPNKDIVRVRSSMFQQPSYRLGIGGIVPLAHPYQGPQMPTYKDVMAAVNTHPQGYSRSSQLPSIEGMGNSPMSMEQGGTVGMTGAVQNVNSQDMNNYSPSVPNMQIGGAQPEIVPIQTEKGEMIVHLDGTITPVNSTKSHKRMKDDEVTDVLPEGAFVASSDFKMKITKTQAENIKLGYDPVFYDEKEPFGKVKVKEHTLADLFGDKKKLTPAQLMQRLKSKYPISKAEDAFADRSSKLNRASRVPYIQVIKELSEYKKSQQEEEDLMSNLTQRYGGEIEEYKKGGAVKSYEEGDEVEEENSLLTDYKSLLQSQLANAQQPYDTGNASLYAMGKGAAGLMGTALQQPVSPTFAPNPTYISGAFKKPDYAGALQSFDNYSVAQQNALANRLTSSGADPFTLGAASAGPMADALRQRSQLATGLQRERETLDREESKYRLGLEGQAYQTELANLDAKNLRTAGLAQGTQQVFGDLSRIDAASQQNEMQRQQNLNMSTAQLAMLEMLDRKSGVNYPGGKNSSTGSSGASAPINVAPLSQVTPAGVSPIGTSTPTPTIPTPTITGGFTPQPGSIGSILNPIGEPEPIGGFGGGTGITPSGGLDSADSPGGLRTGEFMRNGQPFPSIRPYVPPRSGGGDSLDIGASPSIIPGAPTIAASPDIEIDYSGIDIPAAPNLIDIPAEERGAVGLEATITADKAVVSDVMTEEDDPYEYQKRGDSWYFKKEDSDDWTRSSGRAKEAIEAKFGRKPVKTETEITLDKKTKKDSSAIAARESRPTKGGKSERFTGDKALDSTGVYSLKEDANQLSVGSHQLLGENWNSFAAELNEELNLGYTSEELAGIDATKQGNKDNITEFISKVVDKTGESDFTDRSWEFANRKLVTPVIDNAINVLGIEKVPPYLESILADAGINHSYAGNVKIMNAVKARLDKEGLDVNKNKRKVARIVAEERIKYASKYIKPEDLRGWKRRVNRASREPFD